MCFKELVRNWDLWLNCPQISLIRVFTLYYLGTIFMVLCVKSLYPPSRPGKGTSLSFFGDLPWARHLSRHFMDLSSLKPQYTTQEVFAKLLYIDMDTEAQGSEVIHPMHTARRWWSCYSKSDQSLLSIWLPCPCPAPLWVYLCACACAHLSFKPDRRSLQR